MWIERTYSLPDGKIECEAEERKDDEIDQTDRDCRDGLVRVEGS